MDVKWMTPKIFVVTLPILFMVAQKLGVAQLPQRLKSTSMNMEVFVGMSLRRKARKRKGKTYDFAEILPKTDAADQTSEKK